jgi:hypothetical protein
MENETVEKITVTERPTGTVQRQTTITRGMPFSDFFVSKTNQVIFTIIGILSLLLLLRVVILLLGGNQVGFVNTLISITQPFVSPFTGIFPSPSDGVSYLDVASIVAIITYSILGVILGVIIDLFSSKAE